LQNFHGIAQPWKLKNPIQSLGASGGKIIFDFLLLKEATAIDNCCKVLYNVCMPHKQGNGLYACN